MHARTQAAHHQSAISTRGGIGLWGGIPIADFGGGTMVGGKGILGLCTYFETGGKCIAVDEADFVADMGVVNLGCLARGSS